MSDDDLITDHPYWGELTAGASCQHVYPMAGTYMEGVQQMCARQAMQHANPGPTHERHLIRTNPHDFMPQAKDPTSCAFTASLSGVPDGGVWRTCGYPERVHHWADQDRRARTKEQLRSSAVVRLADKAQYERPPMPDAARKGPVVTLIDAPVDPLGTLAVIGGIYTGVIARSKAEVTDEQRRGMLADMQATVLDGPLESIQFTFLIEGVSRAFTHQAVRNRFSFFAQESLRFAVAEDWAQEVPLPPSLSAGRDEDPAVGMWRKALNAAEDSYAALVGAGMPAEEARGVLPHAITTRYYWTVSLRTLLQEAGKRTCTQAQFDWRVVMSGVAKALRDHGLVRKLDSRTDGIKDGWQYRAFADLIRPVCYQQGKCGFMAKFDRGCTIRTRVDANEKLGRPSSEWHTDSIRLGNPGQKYDSKGRTIARAIDPAEWATDPGAART
jgi:flavin-dependent thymidylate synthase